MKRSKVILIGIICILTVALFSYSKENNDYIKPIAISQGQIKTLEKYKLKISENTTSETIENLCEIVSAEYIAGIEYITLTSDKLNDYLYNCANIISIEEIEDCIYIIYRTSDALKIYLVYNEVGFASIGILDEVKNTLVSVTNEGGVLYRNFL